MLKANLPEGKCGNWEVEHFTIPEFDIESMRCAFHGRPVLPGNYTRLLRNRTLVMSDTPAEIRDLFPLFQRASQANAHTVLINGLGLGMAVMGVLQYPNITHVDVVEKSEDVIQLVAVPMFEQWKDRVTIHTADAFLIEWPKGSRWDLVWHDIWDNIPNEDDEADINSLKRKYCRRCKWQGVWAQKEGRRIVNQYKSLARQLKVAHNRLVAMKQEGL